MDELERRRKSNIPESAEVVRLSVGTGVERAKVVLEVRPAPEDAASAEALARWVRGSLGYVASVAGYRRGEVTHVRLWREGRMVEVALEDLLAARGGGNEGDGETVWVASERVREIERPVREIERGD